MCKREICIWSLIRVICSFGYYLQIELLLKMEKAREDWRDVISIADEREEFNKIFSWRKKNINEMKESMGVVWLPWRLICCIWASSVVSRLSGSIYSACSAQTAFLYFSCTLYIYSSACECFGCTRLNGWNVLPHRHTKEFLLKKGTHKENMQNCKRL